LAAYLGQLAALATSVAWSFTSVFFTLSGRQVGSAVVNRIRLLLAVLFTALTHWILTGHPLPLDAEPWRWGYMGLSGLIGFLIGDAFLFQAFVMIGPRLSMLIMALAPVFSTALGWVLLNEVLTGQELAGIGLAVSGVLLVVSDRRNHRDQTPETPDEERRRYPVGLLFALGGSLGQAGGLFVSKLGLQGDFPALSGNLIRLIAASSAIWLLALATGQIRPTFERLREKPGALKPLTAGAVGGPFIGVWLSLIAVQLAPLGIASTLMSLTPVILLPVSYFWFGERFGVLAIMGTAVAFAGTALLFMA
jgi:drug/metabolite transporter (DMT)-like permease